MWYLSFISLLCSILCSHAVLLMDAVGSDDAKAISDALSRMDGKADLNKQGRGGQTPLMHAGEGLRSEMSCNFYN